MTGRKLLIELRDIGLLVVVGYAMTWFGVTCSSCKDNTREFIVIASFTSVLWILLWKGNEYLAEFIDTKISWLKFPLRRFLVGIVTTVIYTLLVMYFLATAFNPSFRFQIQGSVMISVIITIAISLFMHGREFLQNWRKAAIQAEQYKKESMAAKYESLKNQVNPHFLFNSLNALSTLVYEDEEKAAVFIRQLSEVYQYVIEIQDRETVSLQQELRFLDSYLYLQQIRFGGKLSVTIKLDGIQSEVAPLALQMLIENAIKHNIISEDDPLSINVIADAGFITVENNLQRKHSIGDESAGVGLENIRRRYQMLSDRGVQIEESDKWFRVKIPTLKQKMNEDSHH